MPTEFGALYVDSTVFASPISYEYNDSQCESDRSMQQEIHFSADETPLAVGMEASVTLYLESERLPSATIAQAQFSPATSTPISPTLTPIPTATPATAPTPKPVARQIIMPTKSPTPTQTPIPHSAPNLRQLELKQNMLELINFERQKAGLNAVILGDNIAAQLHAESSLSNCYSGHWGIDGLKPYMRYSLAEGYQSNGENGRGSGYCIKASDGYRALGRIEQEIRDAMEGWMDSPGHRRNILRATHRKVNIGLAWDRYNFTAIQHFEGDYVEYDNLPNISGEVLSFSGTTKNGVGFANVRDLGVQIFYDPPPHSLTRGQLTRTYCYDSGLLVAALRRPLTGNSYWPEDEFTQIYEPCPDPYDLPADAPAPRSHDDAHEFWQAAYDASQSRVGVPITVPWITASEWQMTSISFSVKANIGSVPPGVYTITVWAPLGDESEVISNYSIFHGLTPPGTYDP